MLLRPPGTTAGPADTTGPAGAADRGATMVREYPSLRDYERDAARLCRRGWAIVSVLTRDAIARRRGPLDALGRRGPDQEALVTYRWDGPAGAGPGAPAGAHFPSLGSLAHLRHRLTPGRLPASVRGRWLWSVLLVALGLLLADGFLSFLNL